MQLFPKFSTFQYLILQFYNQFSHHHHKKSGYRYALLPIVDTYCLADIADADKCSRYDYRCNTR